MNEVQRELIKKAQKSKEAAQVLLDAGYPGFAASRAYYSMFYLASALLESIDLSFSKHSAVIAAFGKLFIKTGICPVEFHRFITEAQELRQAGDYEAETEISPDRAKTQIERAKQFISFTQEFLEEE